MKHFIVSLAQALAAVLAWSQATGLAAEKAFVHPGILHSRAELEFVKARVAEGKEPWKSAWEELRRHSISQLDWKPKPTANVVGMSSLEQLRINVAAAREVPLDEEQRKTLEARMNGGAVDPQ